MDLIEYNATQQQQSVQHNVLIPNVPITLGFSGLRSELRGGRAAESQIVKLQRLRRAGLIHPSAILTRLWVCGPPLGASL